VALAHSKRARTNPTKNEAGATFPLVFIYDSVMPQMFLQNLCQIAAESPNSSHTFSVDSTGFFVLQFVWCRICAALAHCKRAHISPTKNEAGAVSHLFLLQISFACWTSWSCFQE
jgi:hypothetical protein